MQDFGTKADNSPPPGGQLSAAEFNNLATENENAVLHSGQTLSGASDTQMAQSLFLHGVKAESFQDSGAANAYVATPVSGANGVLLPSDYANLGGAVISFKASATNSGASTLNIGQTTGTLLGTKPIRTQGDAALLSGAISSGQYISVVYNPAFDAGGGAWELLPWSSTLTLNPGATNLRMSVAAASATATLTADSVTVTTGAGGKAYILPAFSKVINLGTTGAGGMDTGTATANGFVGIYAIYNPTTQVSALLATMETAAVLPIVYGGANMPAGYTASALVSVAPIHSVAGQFAVLYQANNQVDYLGANILTGSTAIVSGQFRTHAAIPYSAKYLSGFNQVGNSGLAGVSQILTSTSNVNVGGQFNTTTVNGSSQALPYRVMVGTPGGLYQTTSSTAGTPSFTISVKSFEF